MRRLARAHVKDDAATHAFLAGTGTGSLAGAPTFAGFPGQLDGLGRAHASFQPPVRAARRGVDFHISGITLASGPAGRTVLPWIRVLVQ